MVDPDFQTVGLGARDVEIASLDAFLQGWDAGPVLTKSIRLLNLFEKPVSETDHAAIKQRL